MRSSFLQDLPELGIEWRAQSAPAPRSVLVNDGLAAQLGLDPQRLRTRTGAALLTGTDLPAEQLDEILDPIRLARGLGQTCREHQE